MSRPRGAVLRAAAAARWGRVQRAAQAVVTGEHEGRATGGGGAKMPFILPIRIVLLFLRHNTSYLCMQVQSIFFRIAPERDEGTIEIHRREGKQSQQGFLVDHREKVRHPRPRAEGGLSQNEIQVS
jgi:hypothetical protein